MIRDILRDIADKVCNDENLLTVNSIIDAKHTATAGAYSLSELVDYDFKEAGKGFKAWRDALMSQY